MTLPPSTMPDRAAVPAQAGLSSRHMAADTIPWRVIVMLGSAAALLVNAVVMIALGYAAIAAIGLVFGAGLTAGEIVKQLARSAHGAL